MNTLMPDPAPLRRKLFMEDVARRLANGESLRQVARELNRRPQELRELTRSDEFLAVLDLHDGDLADDIRAEREATKSPEYEDKVLAEATKSVEQLADLRDFAENDNARVQASKAIMDIAEKTKKLRADKQLNRRVTFPASQLEKLHEAAQELRALEELIAKQST